jgi:16S rRNA (guanine527-N7)-methyltransferase
MSSQTGPELIHSCFPELSSVQKQQIDRLGELYATWNEQINVISRKDFEHFYERHVLHSLAIAKYIDLKDKDVLDVGTGGGFPGIPLAILFPDAKFTLMDSVGKKLKVAQDIADQIGLNNVSCLQMRMEAHEKHYDFITGRAITELPQVFIWTKHLVRWHKGKGESGMLYLKGGDFNAELKHIPRKIQIQELSEYYDTEFFETKKLVYVFQ